jgi:hypothetical protein
LALLASSPSLALTPATEIWGGDCAALGGWQFGLLQEVVTEPVLDPAVAARLVRVSRRVTDVVSGEETVWTRAGEPGLVLCSGDVVETWYDAQAVINRTSPSADLPIGLIYPEGGATLYLDRRIRQVRGAASYFLFDERPRSEEFDLEVYIEQSGVVLSRARSLYRVEVVDEVTGQIRVAVDDGGDGLSQHAEEHGVMLTQLDGRGRSRERWVSGGQVQLALPLEDPEPVDEATAASDRAQLARAAGAVPHGLGGLDQAPPPEAYSPPEGPVRLRVPSEQRPSSPRIDGQRMPGARWQQIEVEGEPVWELRQPLNLSPGQHWVVLGAGGVPMPLPVPDGAAAAVVESATEAAEGALNLVPVPVALVRAPLRFVDERLWLPVWAAAGVSRGMAGNAMRLRFEAGFSFPRNLRVGGLLSTGPDLHEVDLDFGETSFEFDGRLSCTATDWMLGLWFEPHPIRRHRVLNRPYFGLLAGATERQLWYRDARVVTDSDWYPMVGLDLRLPVQPLILVPVPVARQLVLEPFVHSHIGTKELAFEDVDTGQRLGSSFIFDVELGLTLAIGSPNRALRAVGSQP